jgi:hypothetical protein
MNLEIYNTIKENKLTVKGATDLFVKMKPATLQSLVRRFCKTNNLESPFQKRGRPKASAILKSQIETTY